MRLCRFSLKWREGAPISEYYARRGGNFKESMSNDPTRIWKQRKESVPALPFIVSINPPWYPSAWGFPRRSRFRQDYCSSTTSIRLNFRMRRHPGTIATISGMATSHVCRRVPPRAAYAAEPVCTQENTNVQDGHRERTASECGNILECDTICHQSQLFTTRDRRIQYRKLRFG